MGGDRGEEPIYWVAEAAGSYRLEVCTDHAGAGVYRLEVEALRPAMPADRARAVAEHLFAEGDRWRREGDVDTALEGLKRALATFTALPDAGREADAHDRLGRVHWELGDLAAAGRHYGAALEHIRSVGGRAEASLRNRLGSVYRRQGEVAKALEQYQQALVIARRIGDRAQEAASLNNLGAPSTCSRRCCGSAARRSPCILRQRLLQARPALAGAAGGRAGVDDVPRPGPSLGHRREALRLFRELPSPWGEATALLGIARAEGGRGELGEARARIAEALEVIESLRAAPASQDLRIAFLAAKHDYETVSSSDEYRRIRRNQNCHDFHGKPVRCSAFRNNPACRKRRFCKNDKNEKVRSGAEKSHRFGFSFVPVKKIHALLTFVEFPDTEHQPRHHLHLRRLLRRLTASTRDGHSLYYSPTASIAHSRPAISPTPPPTTAKSPSTFWKAVVPTSGLPGSRAHGWRLCWTSERARRPGGRDCLPERPSEPYSPARTIR